MKTPLTALLAVASLFLAGCEGPDRAALANEIRNSVPPMAADESFFDGEIVVHLSLGSNVAGAALFGGREGSTGKMSTAFRGNPNTSGFSGDGAGSSQSQGQIHSDLAKTYQGNEGMSRISAVEDGESVAARRAREAQMPPALLRLRIENTGGATVVVQIRDVTSELGDFAVRPDTLTVEGNQTAEVDPMQSLLGVQSHALPVTITLRAGGKTESKVLTLRPVAPETNPPAPAAK